MYKIVKGIHLIALTLFLGSIFGHIVAGISGGAPGTEGFLFAREQIALATRFLTLPGLVLAVVSGIALVRLSRLSPARAHWIVPHAGLTILVIVIAATFVVPAGARLLAGALTLLNHEPGTTAAALVADKHIEDIAGTINVLLTLVIVSLGVGKPVLALRARDAKLSGGNQVRTEPS